MRTLATVAVLLLFNISLLAQKNKDKDKDIPAWGKVEKADLELKECDFDKNAEAFIMFDVGEFVDMMGGAPELNARVRIKILNDKGLDRGDIHIRYHSYRNDEQIRGLEAQTYNLDASGNVVITKVDKKQIFQKALDKHYSEMAFSFPEVKAGSIIEYKYTWVNPSLITWYFQGSIPVKYSRYTLNYLNEMEIACTPYTSLPLDAKSEDKGTRTVKTYAMSNIPALRDEAHIFNEIDYYQRLESRLIAIYDPRTGRRISRTYTWADVVRVLMEDEDFGLQIKKNIPRTDDLDQELKTISDPYKKMATIYRYVRKNMLWTGVDNIWADQGLRAAWKDKKGTSAEINLILVDLLRDAKLDANPLLVSTHDHGFINTLMPNVRDFNKVMAYVTIGDNRYVLDATDKNNPPHLIPFNVMYTEGLAIEKYETYEWGWRTLWTDKNRFKNTTILSLTIDDKDQIKGEGSINSYDYERLNRAIDLKAGKEKFVEAYFANSVPGLSVDSVSFTNEESDSMPLVQHVFFHQPLNASGDYRYFTVNMFTGLEKNPFVPDSRYTDVFFGANQNFDIIASVTIPEGFQFDELPKNIRMIMPDTSISISRRCAAENNQLSVRISLEFKRPIYMANEYPEFHEFYKKLFDLLNEQFVVRKKTKP